MAVLGATQYLQASIDRWHRERDKRLTPSISPKETLERELNRKVSGKEIQPTLERIEQKMVQNQHQETPEFKAIQQKLESLQLPTPPIPKTPKLPGL